MTRQINASYSIQGITDNFVLIADLDDGASVTNDAENVIAALHRDIQGGLGKRKVYYRDTIGQFDELRHTQGCFTGFAPCPDSQQHFLKNLI